jgi:hypothetical protein
MFRVIFSGGRKFGKEIIKSVCEYNGTKPQQALLLWHAPKDVVGDKIYSALTQGCIPTPFEPETSFDFSIDLSGKTTKWAGKEKETGEQKEVEKPKPKRKAFTNPKEKKSNIQSHEMISYPFY